MIRNDLLKQLREWGFWQRTAKEPNLSYSQSNMDTPLQKKRKVQPIFRSEIAETLDFIIAKYMPVEMAYVLQLYYVENVTNQAGAGACHCSIRSFTRKRHDAINILLGMLIYQEKSLTCDQPNTMFTLS